MKKLFKSTKLNAMGFSHVESVLAILVVAVLAVVGVRILTTSHAATPITNGKIYTGGAIINADGTGLTFVPRPTGFQAATANMSSDGTELVYTVQTTTSSANVNTMTTSGTNIKTVSSIPAGPSGTSVLVNAPQWSPNDQWIAIPFEYYGNSKKRLDYSAVYLVQPNGSSGRAVKLSYSDLDVAWLPDSQSLAYVSGKKLCTASDIVSTTTPKSQCVKFASINKKTVALPANGFGGEEDLSVSPDGTKFLAVGYNYPGGTSSAPSADIYIGSMSNGKVSQQLTHEGVGQQIEGVTWSPDGTKIVYNLNDDLNADSGLHVMNADGTGAQFYSTDSVYGPLSWAHK